MVGAGPAGPEAARVAAEAGHRVSVLEASDQAGGQVSLAAKNPRRKEMIGIVDWRLDELERLGAPCAIAGRPRDDQHAACQRCAQWQSVCCNTWFGFCTGVP
ncbi:MAG: FAD/NAD(P)-binding oxidoreductase [Phyllobacterium sp.]|uniref:FAD/NAD(P)-binding oxidoreductase n=1 Tax=Phyllobacterium sp. TaxID=1871046 RepID=UPI0030F27CF5